MTAADNASLTVDPPAGADRYDEWDVVAEVPQPQPDGGGPDGPAGLFGATVTPGRFDPVPIVSIGGLDISSAPSGDRQVVVDGLRIVWGRAEVLEQADPATGTLRLFDPTRTWAVGSDLRGQTVAIRYSGTAGGVAASAVFFRGRIGDPVTIEPKTVRYPDGSRVRGSLITLPLVSVLLDLANRVPTDALWPEETMEARRARIAGLATGALPGGVVIRDFWKTPNAEPVPVANQRSLLEHLVSLYDSSGADRYTYNPQTQQASHLPRRDYWTARGLAGLWWNLASETGHPRAGKGVYARSYSVTASGGSAGVPQYLDAAVLEVDPADGLTSPTRITRVQLVNPDGSDAAKSPNYVDRTTEILVPNVDEMLTGVRTARLESIVTWNSWATLAGQDFRDLVTREGAGWRLAPLLWQTRKSAGFETLEQAQLLLAGYEGPSLVFLQRSWLAEYGIRPLFGVMGGVIGYRAGGWEIELALAPISTTAPQHAISWDEIDDGSAGYQVQWWDEDNPHGMHESLTYEDLGHVSTGLGVGAVPPNNGWDVPAP